MRIFRPTRWLPALLLAGAAPFLLGWFHALSKEAYFTANPHLRMGEVKADPSLYKGETLILAGQILGLEGQGGRYVLKILCYRHDEDGKPSAPDPSCGTFRIGGERVLDPDLFRAGRLATFTATVVGEAEEGDPLFLLGEVHLWPDGKDPPPPIRYYDPWCGPWGYDPWCHPFHPFRSGLRGSLWWGGNW